MAMSQPSGKKPAINTTGETTYNKTPVMEDCKSKPNVSHEDEQPALHDYSKFGKHVPEDPFSKAQKLAEKVRQSKRQSLIQDRRFKLRANAENISSQAGENSNATNDI